MALIIMGVAGCGKSTLAASLARTLSCRFFEGDDFHSAEAIAKMRAGQPLGDDDRWPWLDRLGTATGEAVAEHGLAVASCSALRRSYPTDWCRRSARRPASCCSTPRAKTCSAVSPAAVTTTCRRACSTASSPRWSAPVRTNTRRCWTRPRPSPRSAATCSPGWPDREVPRKLAEDEAPVPRGDGRASGVDACRRREGSSDPVRMIPSARKLRAHRSGATTASPLGASVIIGRVAPA